ncbi:MAG: diaminopimelate epimerase [Candidatus Wallbacteria bacterium]|nr:diaminopimelate epimerase [Candidatus Wallbacteria bacterium]
MPVPWRFAKYHGLGNDFLVGADGRARDGRWAARVCERHRGPGADGVMLVSRRRNRFALHIFNADGSPATFSGNGIRCAAAWLFEQGQVASPLELQTPAGLVTVSRSRGCSMALAFRIDSLRKPGDPPVRSVALPVGLGAGFRLAYHVVLGNPHLVLPVDDADRLAPPTLEALDRARGKSRRFPDAINVSLVAPVSAGVFRLRTWERGVGLSPSCASGACATLYAGSVGGFLPASVRFLQDGGELRVTCDGRTIALEGPIELAFNGEV